MMGGCYEEQVWAACVREHLSKVNDAREHQLSKWGLQAHDPDRWTVILAEEFGEAAKEAFELGLDPKSKTRREALKHELYQTAAVAIAFAQCLDEGEA